VPWSLNGSDAYYNGGNVGIGDSTPDAKLDVHGDVYVDGASIEAEENITADNILSAGNYLDVGDTASASTLSTIHTALRLGVSGGTQMGKLHVIANSTYPTALYVQPSGTGYAGLFAGPVHVSGLLTTSDGSAAKPGGGPWSTYSDCRLKTNIRDLRGTLDQLLALRGVSFEYIDPDSIHELPGTRIGMIAQDVERVFPDWVDQGADGYKRVTYRGFEALTVEALRDLRAERDRKVAEHDAQIDSLRSENADLRARLERLEALVGAGAR
jgi:hypothetical protein